ncbi:MAG: XRE family transcriptional regulator [Candidatus Tectomicrobia bacterium]|uniref:XRE family transcriptional regulator n=1 Tax=Tectimicrobiota bacterium TaxID=2528274 RepID=A0A932I0P7_UNCTE|nr:XRE family transcriptional regulator [Candidatus Tectomicrobia bacterium]
MAATLKEKMKKLPARRRRKIEKRAAELIAGEMSLRDLRKAHRLTQKRVAKSLGITQDGVSRLEKRSDLLISTLHGYVRSMGGTLHLVAEFPDRPPVKLKGFGEMEGRAEKNGA